ncbi:MAG: hypothetical protein CFE24_06780 [Flavobacterium sp. BFFFF2]|nr:MAG: hypothetical protein CFE24_06780 [Flavobacterium sp. BFFFF2]
MIYRGGSPVDFRKANFSSQIKKYLLRSCFSSLQQNLTRGQRPNGPQENLNFDPRAAGTNGAKLILNFG